MTKEEESLLEEMLIETYRKKGITFEDASLYDENQFKTREKMPKLSDVYSQLKKDKKTKRLALLLKPYITGSIRFLDNYTNVDLSNKIVVSDVYGIEEKDLPIVMYLVTEFYWDKIKENRGEKKILYLDEAWKLINQNKETSEFVFKLFKTIRKFGGAATAITQDINDFFSLEEGKFGKGILNNSSIKCIFQLEENELRNIEEVIQISEQERKEIGILNRGECILYAGKERVILNVEASKMEHHFITTDRRDL